MAETLSQQKCVPCSGGVPPVSDAEIAELKPQVPDWQLIDAAGTPQLQRAYKLPNFEAAMALAQRVGAAAEAEGHHPALLVEWGKLTVTWWTHAIGGLHHNDFIMAAKTDRIAQQLGAQ